MTVDLEGFKEKVYRRTQSQSTVEAYMKGVNRLNEFCYYRLGLHTEEAVDRLVKGEIDVYRTLDQFVGWALTLRDREGLEIMPRTVQRYMEGVKKFLRYCGVEISNEKFELKVDMPVADEIPDIALDRGTIRRLLLSSMPLWVRVGIAIMKDAGTRIGETLQIRISDLHLDEEPARISIRKETTKATRHGRMGREVFVTSESVELIRGLIQAENLGGDAKLLNRSDVDQPRLFRKNLIAHSTKLGLGKKIQGHKYHEIHPHIFRKFFFTNAVQAMGETATHAMMGHQFYLKTYYRRSLEDIRKDYQKAAPNLTVMETLEGNLARDGFRLAELETRGFSPDQILILEAMIRRMASEIYVEDHRKSAESAPTTRESSRVHVPGIG